MTWTYDLLEDVHGDPFVPMADGRVWRYTTYGWWLWVGCAWPRRKV